MWKFSLVTAKHVVLGKKKKTLTHTHTQARIDKFPVLYFDEGKEADNMQTEKLLGYPE